MSDLLHVLPSVSLGQVSSSSIANTQSNAQESSLKKRSAGASPVHSLSRLIKGVNGFWSSRSDGKFELESDEADEAEQRKQILALRMRNVSAR
jgi:hypothetical protein